jgi:hypothetical protein
MRRAARMKIHDGWMSPLCTNALLLGPHPTPHSRATSLTTIMPTHKCLNIVYICQLILNPVIKQQSTTDSGRPWTSILAGPWLIPCWRGSRSSARHWRLASLLKLVCSISFCFSFAKIRWKFDLEKYSYFFAFLRALSMSYLLYACDTNND